MREVVFALEFRGNAGPVPGAEGRDFALRFEQACRRFVELRPKPEKTERPRAERTGRPPRPRFDRHERR